MVCAPYLAFGLPSYPELLVILVIGLLIFGRRLPEVGRSVGKTLVQLRKGVQDFKNQLDTDEDLRDVKSTMHDLRKVTEAPRVLANPQQWMDNLTDERQASPGPTTTEVAETDEKSVLVAEAKAEANKNQERTADS